MHHYKRTSKGLIGLELEDGVEQPPQEGVEEGKEKEGVEDGNGNEGVEEGKGKERVYEVPNDVYALIFAYGPGGAFFYASFMLLLQCSAIFLFYWDLLAGRTLGNLFSIPYAVSPQVTAAQAVAVPLCILCHQDFRTALYQLGALYDPDVKEKFPYATRGKWVLVVYLRLVIGFALAFISWIQTIQASTVTDLFLNIEAIIFVGEVDELAFWLAEKNFVTQSLKKSCEATKGISFVASEGHRRTWARRSVALISFLILLGGWATVFVKQSGGYYHDSNACHFFSVYFGDYSLNLDTSKINFAEFKRTHAYSENSEGELVYSSFSGTYAASSWNENSDEVPDYFVVEDFRPSYHEAVPGVAVNDTSLGRFKYCGEYWIFTIEALNVAIDREYDDSEWNRQDKKRWNANCETWLMRSPRTNAYTLEDVGFDGWVVWTGEVEEATDFIFDCEDCRTAVDCNLHGKCYYPNQYACSCYVGHYGRSCGVEACPLLEAYRFGSSSKDYELISSLSPLNQTLLPLSVESAGSFELGGGLKTLDLGIVPPVEPFEEALLLNDRPVYASPIDQDVSLYVYYFGRRWTVAQYNFEEARRVFNQTSPAHGFWDDLHSTASLFFSEPTTSGAPVGLQWFSISESRSRGGFGPFLANSPEDFVISCKTSNCDGRNVCGKYGECNVETQRCECSNCYGGYFCEHPPDSEYAQEQFNLWLKNDMAALEDTDYFREFWEGVNPYAACPDLVEAFLFNNSQSKRHRLLSDHKKERYTKRNSDESEEF